MPLHYTRQVEQSLLEARRQAVLEERNRIARDIHDTLAQGFGAMQVEVSYLCHVISSAAMRAPVMLFLLPLSVTGGMLLQAPAPNVGRAAFERTCARCHGADGQGGEMGPGITTRIPLRTDQELTTLVRDGLPARGMPAFPLADAELRQLLAFVRTLPPRRNEAPVRVSIDTSGAAPLSGSSHAQAWRMRSRPRSFRCPRFRKDRPDTA